MNEKQIAAHFREGAAEIRRLRTRLERAEFYRDHTERLLALFEGGPRRDNGMGESIDIAEELERAARRCEPSMGEPDTRGRKGGTP